MNLNQSIKESIAFYLASCHLTYISERDCSKTYEVEKKMEIFVEANSLFETPQQILISWFFPADCLIIDSWKCPMPVYSQLWAASKLNLEDFQKVKLSCPCLNLREEGVPVSFFFFFNLFRATPMAYGSSQARGQIEAAASGPHHSYSNTRSFLVPHL